MNRFTAILWRLAGSATALAAFSGPALAQDRGYVEGGYDQRGQQDGRWERDGDDRWDPGRRDHGRLHGPGVRYLIPALRDTWQGRQFVIRHSGPNGKLSEREARQANYRFIRFADRNRDGRVSNREARWALNGRGDHNNRDDYGHDR
jgi:hypothetical protein